MNFRLINYEYLLLLICVLCVDIRRDSYIGSMYFSHGAIEAWSWIEIRIYLRVMLISTQTVELGRNLPW